MQPHGLKTLFIVAFMHMTQMSLSQGVGRAKKNLGFLLFFTNRVFKPMITDFVFALA
jgi:hypothetical protein